MHDSVAYFVPTLDPFLEVWEDYGVGYLAYTYENPVDGNTMYIAFITIPNTSDMIELHSGYVGDSYSSVFSTSLDAEDDSCAEAYYPTVSLSNLTADWTEQDAASDDAADDNLPKLMPFGISVRWVDGRRGQPRPSALCLCSLPSLGDARRHVVRGGGGRPSGPAASVCSRSRRLCDACGIIGHHSFRPHHTPHMHTPRYPPLSTRTLTGSWRRTIWETLWAAWRPSTARPRRGASTLR